MSLIRKAWEIYTRQDPVFNTGVARAPLLVRPASWYDATSATRSTRDVSKATERNDTPNLADALTNLYKAWGEPDSIDLGNEYVRWITSYLASEEQRASTEQSKHFPHPGTTRYSQLEQTVTSFVVMQLATSLDRFRRNEGREPRPAGGRAAMTEIWMRLASDLDSRNITVLSDLVYGYSAEETAAHWGVPLEDAAAMRHTALVAVFNLAGDIQAGKRRVRWGGRRRPTRTSRPVE